MMAGRRLLPDAGATEALGREIARLLERGDVVALEGDLGAGKTTLSRAVIQALGHEGDVPSPTFTLVQFYPLAPVALWHFDLYRLSDASELVELGFDEAHAEGICLIEWPAVADAVLPTERLEVRLADACGGRAREARLVGRGNWKARLQAAGLDG